MKEVKGQIIQKLSVAAYILMTLFITLGSRELYLIRRIELMPFWSVLQWIGGSASNGRSILLNIILFIPLGYLLSTVTRKKWHAAIICFSISLLIEVLQLITLRGICDVDDLIFNTLGGAIGVLICTVLPYRLDKSGVIVALVAGVVGSVLVITIHTDPVYERQFYFCAELRDSTLSGQCYYIDNPTPAYKVIINGKTIAAERERTYRADTDEQGEIFVKFAGHQAISTGVYIRNGQVKYTAEDVFIPGVPADWTLMVWNEEYDTMVYEAGDQLIWLIGSDIEPTTEIIYHIHTDEPEKLPEKRKLSGFDNRGFRTGSGIELDEIDHYRVFQKEIPQEYHITSITVGFNPGGHVVWSDTFRIY